MPQLTNQQFLWRASLRVATEIAQNQGKFDFHDANSLANIVETITANFPKERKLKNYDQAYVMILQTMAQLVKMQNNE